MTEVLNSILEYAKNIDIKELLGLIFGLLCVYFLIKGNILTFVFGIAYVIVSFFVFWEIRLYGDFILHIFFLVLNIYGWYYWVHGDSGDEEAPITHSSPKRSLILIAITGLGVFAFGYFLANVDSLFGIEASTLPYWDATTSILSVTGMWLTAKKRIDNWYYWLIVDVLATGIYAYKGIYFYSFLYLIYIGMAIAGYLAWKKTMTQQEVE